jgi:hypothetical protein
MADNNDTTDVPSDEKIAEATKLGDTLFDELIDKIGEAVAEENVDGDAVLYALWVDITQILATRGWTADQLIREVQHHVALQTSEGGMQ